MVAARTVIVGDIHGCYDELLDLLRLVDLREDDLLVSVGDLVDRGPQPAEVVDLFRDRANSVAVMGNHERKHVRGVLSYSQEVTRAQLGDRYEEIVGWMRTLPYFFENEQVRVVHAAVLSGVPLAEQRPEVLCGSTSGARELTRRYPDGPWYESYTDTTPVVFGHHVVGPEPLVRDDRVPGAGRVFGIDTGACHGGNLSAVCVPGFTVHSVPARADHWSSVRQRWQLTVVRARPWPDRPWAKLDRDVTELMRTGDAATRDWLTGLRAWTVALVALAPDLVAAATRLADGADTDRLRRHPAARFLLQAREGRLDPDSLVRQCRTPRAVCELAGALGVAPPRSPG